MSVVGNFSGVSAGFVLPSAALSPARSIFFFSVFLHEVFVSIAALSSKSLMSSQIRCEGQWLPRAVKNLLKFSLCGESIRGESTHHEALAELAFLKPASSANLA